MLIYAKDGPTDAGAQVLDINNVIGAHFDFAYSPVHPSLLDVRVSQQHHVRTFANGERLWERELFVFFAAQCRLHTSWQRVAVNVGVRCAICVQRRSRFAHQVDECFVQLISGFLA